MLFDKGIFIEELSLCRREGLEECSFLLNLFHRTVDDSHPLAVACYSSFLSTIARSKPLPQDNRSFTAGTWSVMIMSFRLRP